MKNLKGTAGDTSIILFGTISGGITAELTGKDGALRKCPVDIFSERASMRRERQGAVYEPGIAEKLYSTALNSLSEIKVLYPTEIFERSLFIASFN